MKNIFITILRIQEYTLANIFFMVLCTPQALETD